MADKIFLPLDNDKKLQIHVTYTKGGMSWATGQTISSGYKASVNEIKQTKQGNVIITEYSPMDGFSVHLLDANRRSKKKQEEAIRIANECADEFKEIYLKRKDV